MTKSHMTISNIARAGCVLVALGVAASPATSAVSSLRNLAGTWSGGGMLSLANGEQQRLRCRASYDVAGRGYAVSLNLRCASDSYNFDLTGNVEDRNGLISGQWSEATRNASGTIEGRAAGDHIEAAARGQNFSANLSLTTRGNRQTVSIQPAGTDVRNVTLALARR
jgi:hypothetical protein